MKPTRSNPLAITEASFQNQVVDLARTLGWRIMHTRPAQVRSGRWVTPLTGDPGFPDLVLARPNLGDLIFAELKRPGGRVSDHQRVWLDCLLRTGAEAYLWEPRDLPAIRTRLQTKGKP